MNELLLTREMHVAFLRLQIDFALEARKRNRINCSERSRKGWHKRRAG